MDYAADVRKLCADPEAAPEDLDATLTKQLPSWLVWEIPTIFLELDRGGAPVCPENQARIRGLQALHILLECYESPDAFEGLAWLLSGVEAPHLVAHPVDLLRVLRVVRAVAAAHGEAVPAYAPDVLERVAERCRQAGYVSLPSGYGEIQELIDADLSEEGLSIEKKARQQVLSALSLGKHASVDAFEETPEGVAAARHLALEIALKR